jgi:hypothetical protein
MKKQEFFKSVLCQISTDVFQMKCPKQAKQHITNFLDTKHIEEKDKTTILNGLKQCTTIHHVHKYVVNSLLRFEGLSVNSYKTKQV